ncbi:fatty acid desaturase [Coraliomargarita sinensis]|uniref:Fatty acid desaturase n=1 Tax=Coraliomargarita sinensis TaxID=2174842 RepID=A0A317ZMK2_9BACT|nr:fatty acid desaturase [Coraliomargarita sinensis]PXA05049.1 fatty acid desaturase [Coraliomargarita sinensis]
MRTGKELILATREFAKDNTARSWWVVVSTVLLYIAALAATLLLPYWILKIPASILTGLLTVRLFVIYHDHQHNAILAKSKPAAWFMRFWGIYAMTPSSIWKHSHNHHHNHNSKLRSSHIGSYPVMTRARYQNASKNERFKYLAIRHPLTILCGYFSVFIFGMCIVPAMEDPKAHRDSVIALLLHITLYTLVIFFLGWMSAFLLLFLPFFIASALGAYLFYAQHNFSDVTYMDKDGWTYEGAALVSSSFCKMSPIMHFFTANIGYHHIHHLNAKIPFYRLPEVLEKMPELQSPKTTSLRPSEILRCLRLKVWDVERQQMVGVS